MDMNDNFEERQQTEAASSAEEESSVEEVLIRQQESERKALKAALYETRKLSAKSQLTTAQRWDDAGIVPDHMTSEEFEMFVYDYLKEAQLSNGPAPKPPVQKVFRTATTMVGVPQSSGSTNVEVSAEEPETDEPPAAEGELIEEPGTREEKSSVDTEEYFEEMSLEEAGLPEDYVIPEGFALALVEGEPSLVPRENIRDDDLALDTDGIVILLGHEKYYLYSRNHMSDQYAHWSFLAQEDNKVATLVDCVREESRIYPRPMPLKSLKNPPFGFSESDIEDVWTAIRESGEYPDIARVVASNGDIYFHSTLSLSHAHAQSLAEWDAVERQRAV